MITEEAGVSYVCPRETVEAEAEVSIPATGRPSTEQLAERSEEVPPPSVYSTFANGRSNVVDRLAASGFEPAGCIAGEKGPRFAMRNGTRTIMVYWQDAKNSQIAPIVQCRV